MNKITSEAIVPPVVPTIAAAGWSIEIADVAGKPEMFASLAGNDAITFRTSAEVREAVRALTVAASKLDEAQGAAEGRRVMTVKYEDCSKSWDDPEFHVIHVPYVPATSKWSARRAQYAALSVAAPGSTGHPVDTAKVGETYQYKVEGGGMSPLYEYVGRFTLLYTFRDDAGQQWNVIQEVAA